MGSWDRSGRTAADEVDEPETAEEPESAGPAASAGQAEAAEPEPVDEEAAKRKPWWKPGG